MEGEHGADAHKNHDVSSNVSPPPAPPVHGCRRPCAPQSPRELPLRCDQHTATVAARGRASAVNGYGTAGRPRGRRRRCRATDPTVQGRPGGRKKTASGRAPPKVKQRPEARQQVAAAPPSWPADVSGTWQHEGEGSATRDPKQGGEVLPRGVGRPLGRCATEAGCTTHVLGTGPGTCVSIWQGLPSLQTRAAGVRPIERAAPTPPCLSYTLHSPSLVVALR